MAPLRRIRSNLVPDWSRQSEELADLPLATEAAGRDRVGLTLVRCKRSAWRRNVADSAELQNDFPVEASIPDGGVTLDSILCTEELRRRPCRPPDYQKENRTLAAGRRAISVPAETCSIATVHCCSNTSSGVTPICCQ